MKRVLVCPLDWGIGHATRSVPLIRILCKLGFEVIVAADNRPLEFLRREFPDVRMFRFPGAKIRYPKTRFMWLKMLQLTPWLIRGIWKEHILLQKIVVQTGADLVISDNRFGCWHPSVPSVFITHQLDIQVPAIFIFMKAVLNKFNHYFIGKYGECWIPDFELHKGLASALSHPLQLPCNAFYIGILSRFSVSQNPRVLTPQPDFDLLVMLSGPEPQRTLLEEKIITQLRNIILRVVIVQGLPETDSTYMIGDRIQVFSHVESERMRNLILQSELVICRSGYSSIMDLATLGKRAIFIPTPGQTEQEYLAHNLMDRKIFFSMEQQNFDLLYAIEMSKNYPGMVLCNDYSALEERISLFAGKPGK